MFLHNNFDFSYQIKNKYQLKKSKILSILNKNRCIKKSFCILNSQNIFILLYYKIIELSYIKFYCKFSHISVYYY